MSRYGELYPHEVEKFQPLTDAGFKVELTLPDAGETTYVITHPRVPSKRILVGMIEIDLEALKEEFGID